MRRVVLALACALFFTNALVAQSNNPLIGAWERTMLKNPQGQVTQPPLPPAFVIFSANGYFSQTAIPAGRPKLNKPVAEMTKDELVARFQNVEARRGTYKIDGKKLTRTDVSTANSVREGAEQIQLFRIEGDTLILSTEQGVDMAWFKRVK
jgi:hypothetical protein